MKLHLHHHVEHHAHRPAHHPHPHHDLLRDYRINQPDRYSAKKMAKPVPFTLFAPQAKTVFVAGDFNEWDLTADPMIRRPDGAWRLEVPLNHGHHHYLFVVDGKLTLDPRAHGAVRDHQGRRVSVVAVS